MLELGADLCREESLVRIDVDPERALLERVAQRDQQAFRLLYRHVHRRVYHFLYRMLHQKEVVEEAVDDVMLTVWEKADQFRGQSKVSTWILGIAHRKGLKHYRKESARRVFDDLDQHARTVSDEGTAAPDRSLENTQLLQQIETAMVALSVNHRSVMELAMLGYSCAEISTIVGCPVNTVKTRMFHARRNMRSHMEYQPSTDGND